MHTPNLKGRGKHLNYFSHPCITEAKNKKPHDAKCPIVCNAYVLCVYIRFYDAFDIEMLCFKYCISFQNNNRVFYMQYIIIYHTIWRKEEIMNAGQKTT